MKTEEITIDSLKLKQKELEENSRLLEEIVDSLVEECCGMLNDYMGKTADKLCNNDTLSDRDLEDITLKLPNIIYFTNDLVESLGLKYDVASSKKQREFNSIHLSTQGTIADKKSKAELLTLEDTFIQMCYDRAYKKVKQKVDAGYEELKSAKKVLERRNLAMQITLSTNGGVGDLR